MFRLTLNRFEFRVWASFLAAMLVVGGLLIATWHVATDARASVLWVAHSQEVLANLARLGEETLQVEISTQNFRVTGDAARLVERDQAIAAREVLLSQLNDLTADNPAQQSRWMALRHVIDERIAISKRIEAARKTQGVEAATLLAATMPLKATRDRLHQLRHDMETEERQWLGVRLESSRQAQQSMRYVGPAAGIMLAALLTSVFVFIRRQMHQSEASRRAAAASEQSLSTTLNSIGDGVIATDVGARVTRMNPVAEQLTGWSLSQALGRPIDDVFKIIHHVLIAADGHERPITDSAAPIRDADGRLHGVVLVFRDVSAEHAAERAKQAYSRSLEERVRERTRELEESNERYKTLFRTSPDALTLTSLPEGHYLDVNDGFSRLFGWAREDVIGKTATDIGIWRNPAHRTALLQAMTDQGQCEGFEAEFLSMHGKSITALVSAQILDMGGKPCMLSVTQDITERKTSAEQIEHLAFYDSLTDLPNRRLMLDRLSQALNNSARSHRHGAVLMIDLDNFKSLNDTLGHHVGDQLLIEVAQRLRSCIRVGDSVSRLGGDEFVVILEHLDDGNEGEQAAIHAERISDKLLARLGEPYLLAVPQTAPQASGKPTQVTHHGTSSIGIALFRAEPVTAEDLLKRADTAMYQAKTEGRNTTRFFDLGMQAAVAVRAKLELDLHRALENNEFLLHYQMQVDATGRIIGAEALIRWQHPEDGLVMPGMFIAVAEETRLIMPMGQWVLESACRQLARWAKHPATANITLAVNVSASQFHLPHFVDLVLTAIKTSGARADKLKLELTESLLLNSTDDIIGKMNTLKQVGIQFSLDDFGTGYSSLAYLKKLPLDQLKIDKSFVDDVLTDPSDAVIARTIVNLSRSLDLDVIAEGVETQEQRDFLFDAGCLVYQGYLFSRPLPLTEFESLALRQAERRRGEQGEQDGQGQ
jgi:diguanylate cyclase (GGDEF)-like protein/PAS domain S-box-containing protein